MNTRHPTMRSLRLILPLVPRKERRRFWGLLALSVFASSMELALAGLVALLAAIFGSPEAVLSNNPVRWLRENLGLSFGSDPRFLALSALCGIFLLIMCKNMLNIIQQSQTAAFSEKVGVAARTHIFRFFQRAPFLWIAHKGVAELNFGLEAAKKLAEALNAILQISSNALTLLALVVGLVSVSPLSSLVLFAVLGVCGSLIIQCTRKFLDRQAQEAYMANYHLNRLTHLALHGLRDVRFNNRENILFNMYAGQLSKAAHAAIRQQASLRIPAASLETLGFGALVVMMVYLSFVQDAGMARISGTMGFMAAAAWRGLPVANRLLDSLTFIRPRLPYLHNAVDLLMAERSLSDELLPLDIVLEPLAFQQEIVLENISFRYPNAETDIVREISMTIKVGKLIGLIGFSGAGKSTLIRLITGLVSPESGRILIDGIPVTKANAAVWRSHIGYVAQDPYILDDSLAANIAFSRLGESIDREKVLECCRMAAIDFLDALEDGIDTILGERGIRLSGGQIQRVAIARALYADPALLIFDEATSSLDIKNERAIHETILSLRDKVTILIVAHRLTTVEGCDSIVWLDNGMIHQAGAAATVLEAYCKTLDTAGQPYSEA